ncbi:MAG: heavy-metal-associated domain-containing protein [Flavobacteriales bacterium]|nr:heavy-metal-associated domain-containing protein [Flavobacteriales bacterium]
MKHLYEVSGMTCGSCKAKVEKALTGIKHVESVDVDLEKGRARVRMREHIPTEQLQTALATVGEYSISPTQNAMEEKSMILPADDKESYSFKPLVLVLGFILLLVMIGEYNQGSFDWMRFMKNYMGGFFIAFSFFKLLDLKGFAYSYLSYDIITKKWLRWGFIYPFVELILGIFFLMGFQLRWTLITTIVVMGLSSIGVIRAVLDKQKIKCACLGTGFNLPMSTVTIIEDVGMVLMSIIMLIYL